MKSDRLNNESAKAYEAFKTFCELGHKRSIRLLSRTMHKSVVLLQGWSKKHGWPMRAKQYDENLIRIQRESEQKSIEQQSKSWAARTVAARGNAWDMAQEFRARAKKMLQWPMEKKTTTKNGKTVNIHPAKWNMTDAARFGDIATKLEYLATGQSTENVSHSGPDGGPIIIEATAVPFTPEHVRSCYLDKARREVADELAALRKKLSNGEPTHEPNGELNGETEEKNGDGTDHGNPRDIAP